MPQSDRQHRFNNRLLAALPPADIERFFSDLEAVEFPRGQLFQPMGEPFVHIYFIERGICSMLTLMEDGSTIEFGMVGSEGMVGLPALLGAEVSAQQCMAQADTQSLRVGVARGKEAYEESREVRRVFNLFTQHCSTWAGRPPRATASIPSNSDWPVGY